MLNDTAGQDKLRQYKCKVTNWGQFVKLKEKCVKIKYESYG